MHNRDRFDVDQFTSFQSRSTFYLVPQSSRQRSPQSATRGVKTSNTLWRIDSGYSEVPAVLTKAHCIILMPMSKNTKIGTNTNASVSYPLVGDTMFWKYTCQSSFARKWYCMGILSSERCDLHESCRLCIGGLLWLSREENQHVLQRAYLYPFRASYFVAIFLDWSSNHYCRGCHSKCQYLLWCLFYSFRLPLGLRSQRATTRKDWRRDKAAKEKENRPNGKDSDFLWPLWIVTRSDVNANTQVRCINLADY